MYEYDEELKLRSLITWEFNIDNLNINNIIHVPMHQYRITNKNMLYIDNLQCCVGLYAYSNSFAFAAHINPYIFRGDEFILDNNIPIYFKRIDDLKKELLQIQKKDSIKIGISLGYNPLDKNYPSMILIYNSINKLITDLNSEGYNVELLDDINAPEFIIDIENQKLILPKEETLKLR